MNLHNKIPSDDLFRKPFFFSFCFPTFFQADVQRNVKGQKGLWSLQKIHLLVSAHLSNPCAISTSHSVSGVRAALGDGGRSHLPICAASCIASLRVGFPPPPHLLCFAPASQEKHPSHRLTFFSELIKPSLSVSDVGSELKHPVLPPLSVCSSDVYLPKW